MPKVNGCFLCDDFLHTHAAGLFPRLAAQRAEKCRQPEENRANNMFIDHLGKKPSEYWKWNPCHPNRLAMYKSEEWMPQKFKKERWRQWILSFRDLFQEQNLKIENVGATGCWSSAQFLYISKHNITSHQCLQDLQIVSLTVYSKRFERFYWGLR